MKDLLFGHWRWKAISLALSGVLWMATVGEPESSTSLTVPVYYQNSPHDLEITSSVIDRVRLEVHGPSSKLNQHSMSNAAVVVDLTGVTRPGERTFPLDRATIALPPGVQVDHVAPPQVRLLFERRVRKEVPVMARVGVQPPQGYEVVALSVVPPRLSVEGPESSMESLTAAETDALDLSGVTGREVIPAHATLDDPQVRFLGQPRVAVQVEVRKAGGGN